MKNAETNRQKMGNDLATELLLFCAFFCIFLFHQVCKLMLYSEINQLVTLICQIFQSGNILLTCWFTQKNKIPLLLWIKKIIFIFATI